MIYSPDNGKELLSMDQVLSYSLNSSTPLLPENKLRWCHTSTRNEWRDYVIGLQGMLVTVPGKVRLELVAYLSICLWYRAVSS